MRYIKHRGILERWTDNTTVMRLSIHRASDSSSTDKLPSSLNSKLCLFVRENFAQHFHSLAVAFSASNRTGITYPSTRSWLVSKSGSSWLHLRCTFLSRCREGENAIASRHYPLRIWYAFVSRPGSSIGRYWRKSVPTPWTFEVLESIPTDLEPF